MPIREIRRLNENKWYPIIGESTTDYLVADNRPNTTGQNWWPKSENPNQLYQIHTISLTDQPEISESAVNHPKHYNNHPSGVEAITVCEHMSFNLGNVVKYLWRADEKGAPIEDLQKALWYLNREIERRGGE